MLRQLQSQCGVGSWEVCACNLKTEFDSSLYTLLRTCLCMTLTRSTNRFVYNSSYNHLQFNWPFHHSKNIAVLNYLDRGWDFAVLQFSNFSGDIWSVCHVNETKVSIYIRDIVYIHLSKLDLALILYWGEEIIQKSTAWSPASVHHK
jgi:hypothetical protein